MTNDRDVIAKRISIDGPVEVRVLLSAEEARELRRHCDLQCGCRQDVDLIRLRTFSKVGRAADDALRKCGVKGGAKPLAPADYRSRHLQPGSSERVEIQGW